MPVVPVVSVVPLVSMVPEVPLVSVVPEVPLVSVVSLVSGACVSGDDAPFPNLDKLHSFRGL